MKSFYIRISAVLLTAVLFFSWNGTTVYAASAAESVLTEEEQITNTERVQLEKQRVYDMADLLTDDEEAALESCFREEGVRAGADIILVTSDDMEGKTDTVYLEDFQDELYFEQGILAVNAAMMLINMEERYVVIQGYGDCEFWLNNDRIEYILDLVSVYLGDGDYYGAAESFAQQVEYYMQMDSGVSTDYLPGQDYGESAVDGTVYYPGSEYSVGRQIKDTLRENLPMTIIVSLAVSGIICLIINSGRKTKVTITHRTYLEEANSGITAKRDDYLRTTVSKVRKPSSSSGSGGRSGGFRSSGGGGRSSGGRSHSGGRRGF